MREVQRATRPSMSHCLFSPDVDAELIPDPEYDYSLGLWICATEMAYAEEGGCGSGAGRVR